MQVVHLDHTLLADECASDRLGVGVVRGALEEDHRRFAQQLGARPEHQRRDREAGDRVEAVPARGEDEAAGDGSGAEGGDVGHDVQEGAANVQALTTRAGEDEAGGDAHHDAAEGDEQHETAAHVMRIDEPVRGRPHDPQRDQAERDAVGLGGEDLEARVAERPAAGRRTCRHRRGDEREPERRSVGEQMSRVGEESERMAEHPGDDLRSHEHDHEQERDGQRPAIRHEPVIVIVCRTERLVARPP